MSDRLPRMAIVHDWLDTWGGGENVLAEIVGMYPHADLFSLVDFMPDSLRARLNGRRAHTTFLQHMPAARRRFRLLLPLFPWAIESLDVSAYDVILSSSHAVAKGVSTTAAQLHICYCHTPMRYAWDMREEYLRTRGLRTGLRGAIVNRVLDGLREWDRRTSANVTHFIANSAFVQARIARCYDRASTIIYPPVDTDFFTPLPSPVPLTARDYYFAGSRWVPYKRLDLIVEAFRVMPGRRLIVAGDGPELPSVRTHAPPNVEFVGQVSRERMRELMRGARAFVFAAREDFGIVAVEALACGTPVIAFGEGGVREIVDDARTGCFFGVQSGEAIAAAVARFEATLATIDPRACTEDAQSFSTSRFATELNGFVERAYAAFISGTGGEGNRQ